MDWSKLPRPKKILVLSLAALVVILAAVAGYVQRSKQASADTSTAGVSLDNSSAAASIRVLFKVVDSKGQPAKAFVDAIYDLNGNCSIDNTESDGFTGETQVSANGQTDGSAVLNLTQGQYYVIRAVSEQDSTTADQGVAIGNINAKSCMKVVTTANSDPIVLTLK